MVGTERIKERRKLVERGEQVERREGNLQSGCKINEKINFIKEKKRDTLFFLLRLQIKYLAF